MAKVCSAAVGGSEAYPVQVEVNAGDGDPLIAGLATQHRKSLLASARL